MLPFRRFSWGIVTATLALASACSPDTPPGILGGADGSLSDIAATDTGGQCLATQIACGASCVSPATDPANCGTCGRRCGAGEFCMSGMCMGGVASDGATPMPDAGDGAVSMGDGATMIGMDAVTLTCPDSLIRCGSACVDISTDRGSCGGCGRACSAGQSCLSGVCMAVTPPDVAPPTDAPAPTDTPVVMPCPGAQIRCGGACFDISTDRGNCGGCGRPCGAGQTCMSGACVAEVVDSGVVPCTGSQIRCNNVCTDLSTSTAHCGGCNRPCASGQICNAGACMTLVMDSGVAPCPGAQLRCNNVCTDLSTSAAHCGGCNRPCASGQTCSGGACVSPVVDAGVVDSGVACGSGEIVCGVVCANPATDRNNCGRCGNACPGGQICNAGACVSMTMDAGLTCTGGQIMCSGMCINPATSQDHCGGCNNRCQGNTGCINGTCQSTMTIPDVPPPSDGGGVVMDSGVVSCTGGLISCAGMCVNPASNQSHCGGCNNRCQGSTACVGGTCVSTMTTPDGGGSGTPDTGSGGTCSGGQISCAGMCVNPATNQAHCGGCNNPCLGNTACVSGTCQSTMTMGGDGGVMGDGGSGNMCAPGQTVCSGVCRDLNFDPSNCGSCGRVCPSGNYCDRGMCMGGPSGDGGTGDGGGGGGDGGAGSDCTMCGTVCAYVYTDPLNCGGCNIRCGTGQLCLRGVCTTATTCGTGLTMCGTICTDITRDTRHCGGCNRACTSTQRCGMGVCR